MIGLLILNAKTFGIEGEAKILLKSIHVYVGYIFSINLAWRLVWAFIGGHYARWRQILPVGKAYIHSLKSYISSLGSGVRQQYLGHNPAARLIVSLFFLLLSIQAATGLIIAGTDLYLPPFGNYFAEWVTEGDTERLNGLKPGDKTYVVDSAYTEMRAFRKPVVTVHVYNFYALFVLVLLHIAGVVVTEIKEKNGLVSAMITGEKVLDDEPQDKKE
jgi:cytochrome b